MFGLGWVLGWLGIFLLFFDRCLFSFEGLFFFGVCRDLGILWVVGGEYLFV